VSELGDRIREGMARGAAMGRKPGKRTRVSDKAIRAVIHLGTLEAARRVGLSKSQYITRRRRLEEQNGQ